MSPVVLTPQRAPDSASFMHPSTFSLVNKQNSGRVLLLAEGHGKKKLKGLVTHPKDPDIYATVGDDAFVRVRTILLSHLHSTSTTIV